MENGKGRLQRDDQDGAVHIPIPWSATWIRHNRKPSPTQSHMFGSPLPGLRRLNGSYEDKLKMATLLTDYGVYLSKRSKPMFYLLSKDNNYNPGVIRLLEIFKVAPKNMMA